MLVVQLHAARVPGPETKPGAARGAARRGAVGARVVAEVSRGGVPVSVASNSLV